MKRRFMTNSSEICYMYIETLYDGTEIYCTNTEICYKVGDSGEWNKISDIPIPILKAEVKVYFMYVFEVIDEPIGMFDANKEFKVGGDLRTLLYGNDTKKNSMLYAYCFEGLFKNSKIKEINKESLPATTIANSCYKLMFSGCTSLVNAPELPATTLKNFCYESMFKGCTGLTVVPTLPATTLTSACYRDMFRDCTSLAAAPALPATELAESCYYSMFYNCTGLIQAPELLATELENYCYGYMFNGCKNLTDAPELPATTLKDGCYTSMFAGCKSLIASPKLPATILVTDCYHTMFEYCYNLKYIKMLATDISARNCLYFWVDGVASTGTFVKNKDAIWDVVGESGVPEGWTVITNDQESGGKTVNKITVVISEDREETIVTLSTQYPVASDINGYVVTSDRPEMFTIFKDSSSKSISIIDVEIQDFYLETTEDDTYIYELVIE